MYETPRRLSVAVVGSEVTYHEDWQIYTIIKPIIIEIDTIYSYIKAISTTACFIRILILLYTELLVITSSCMCLSKQNRYPIADQQCGYGNENGGCRHPNLIPSIRTCNSMIANLRWGKRIPRKGYMKQKLSWEIFFIGVNNLVICEDHCLPGYRRLSTVVLNVCIRIQ